MAKTKTSTKKKAVKAKKKTALKTGVPLKGKKTSVTKGMAKVLKRTLAKTTTAKTLPQIDPLSIYGFKEALQTAFETNKPFVLSAHPDFPNPRTVLNDHSKEIVADIVDSGSLLEPIKVMRYKSDNKAKYVFVLVDGFTRMTGVGRHMQENPSDVKTFATVPYLPHDMDINETRSYMARINFERENLDDLMVANHLLYLESQGVTEEEQAVMFGKNNRGGKRWMRAMKEVAKSKELSQAVKRGDISTTTAQQVASQTKDEGKRKETAKKVADATKKEQKKPTKSGKKTPKKAAEKTAAKQVGARRTNMTTLGVNECFALIANEYVAWKAAVKQDDADFFDDVDWAKVKDREQACNVLMLFSRMDAYFAVMKIDDKTAPEQAEWVEARLPDAVKTKLKKVKLDEYVPLVQEGD